MQGGAERFLALLHEKLHVPYGTNESKLIQKYFVYQPEEEAALRSACEAMLQSASKTDNKMGKTIASWLENRTDAVRYAESFFTIKGTLRKEFYTQKAEELNPNLPSIIAAEAARAQGFMHEYKTLRLLQSSEHMMVLARALLGHYREAKARRGVMDFDDLIMHTVRLLRRSGAAAWVLFKLDGTIDHLLVDEAQDTSPEQWQIVEALVDEFFAGESARSVHRTLFVVGDEKQSIFSFQGADPNIFDNMRRSLAKRAKDAGKLFSHERLGLSFRSTEAVLAAVDSVFSTAEAREGLVFSETDFSHTAHRTGQAGRVELWPLIEGEKKEKKMIWDVLADSTYIPSPEQRMAQAITAEIAGWLKEGRILPAHARPVRPGDIMILVRQRGGFNHAMLRALKRAGIPVAGSDRLVITDHIAVMDCMALGDFLLLPQDDLTLATVLKSPFIGLSEEALFTLAYNRGKQSLWQSLKSHPEFGDAAEFLSHLLARVDYMPPYELFSHALITRGKRKKIAERLGREADDPLGEFLSLALQYERSHPPSLQGFLHWLRSSETEIKRDMEKGRDEVRILTVHASKGLQAPIIFLPDTTSTPRHPDNLQWLAGEPSLPLWSETAQYDDATMDALKEAASVEAYKEYRRLLYVAMTRAEDELYICGWKGDRAASEGCWYELIKNAVDASDKWQMNGNRKILLNSGNAKKHIRESLITQTIPPFPAWAHLPAQEEPRPSKPLSPSRMTESVPVPRPQTAASARARGVLVHRLLQYLPECLPQQHSEVIKRFVERYGALLSAWECDEAVRQVMSVLSHPEFAPVFSPHSVAEAPIVGVVEGKDGLPVTIAGQIDRLAVVGDTVFIVDFKTGKEVPLDASSVPEAYKRQMEAYRKLVQKIYPDKTIKCAILWTSVPVLIALDAFIAA
jgi:ATP-dependent helicase/nuclease subunit A